MAVRRVRSALFVLVGVIAAGTIGYVLLEGWSLLDALYMTVITIGTVGFEEVRDISGDPSARVLTIVLVIAGVGAIAFAGSSLVELVVAGTVSGYYQRRRMEKMIAKLSGHYIVCGYGRVGREVAEELRAEGVEFVVVDEDEDAVQRCREEGYLVLQGNAADDDLLATAGVSRAKGLIAAVDSDPDNVFVVLSAHRANPKLHIVARADIDESVSKLELAGASRTLSPYAFGGRHLARLATRPLIVDYLDLVTGGERRLDLRLEELEVAEGSLLANRTVAEVEASEDSETRLLAIRKADDTFDLTPAPSDRLQPGDILIVLGRRDEIAKLEARAGD